MNCDSVSKLIPLYFYGEVSPEEEDQVDQHIGECPACAALLEQQRALAAALDERLFDPSPVLLEECRDDLMAAIAGGAPRQVKVAKGPWTLFLEAMGATLGGFGRMRQPVGALMLVLLGFMAARFVPTSSPNVTQPGFAADIYPTVRDVKADGNGMVHINLDETRRREVTGRLEDANIQHLLVAGSREENPAVRVESVSLLRGHADAPAVLDSLLNALTSDPNDGVRLKALDALRPMAGDPRVSKSLSQVLLSDANPAMRMQVIELMGTRRDDSFIPILQNLMQREDNSGVRLKASQALKERNASIGSF